MTEKQEEVAHFIRLIRGISPQYLRYACTHGACHRFYLVLKDRFPSARLYFTRCDGGGHCVAKIHGLYWDIYGEHEPDKNGDVRPPKTKKEVVRMSSCHFDEAYIMLNPFIVREFDTNKPEETTG